MTTDRGTCQACGKSLQRWQVKFCSCACSNRANTPEGRISTDEVSAKMPTDDYLWEHRRTIVIHELASEVGLPRGTLVGRLHRAGWKKRGIRYGFTHAPCRLCGASTRLDDLSDERVCPSCLTRREEGPVDVELAAMVQHELRRRLPGGDRFEAWHLMEPCVIRPSGFSASTAMHVRRGYRTTRHRAAA